MPHVGGDARRPRSYGDRQAAEVQAPGSLLGGPGEDGQLTGSRAWALAIIGIPCCLALGVGCGQGLTRGAAIDSFRDVNSQATQEQAACVVDGLVDRYGLDDLEAELSSATPNADFEEDQFREMFLCGVDGDWRGEVTTQLIANGVAAEDAPCVTDDLFATMTDDDIGVLLTGEITDSFADKFYAALETCDALNP